VRPGKPPGHFSLIASEAMRPRLLNKDEFAQVVRNAPLVAIDVIIRNPDHCVLVGLRTNAPAKGKWFVPGGVVRKYERLAEAFARIVKAEIGFEASIENARFLGVYEHLYDSNFLEAEEFGTHYVVLAYELNLDRQPPIVSDGQHSDFRWMTPAQLTSSPEVHHNTRTYFL
jgi:GDP-mannose mannosyl hydrolase